MKTIVIQYDFTKLLTVADAEALTELVNSKTKGLDIGILANNVGILAYGPYHKTGLEKMFNSFTVNIAA